MAEQSALKNPYLVVPFKYGLVGGILSVGFFITMSFTQGNPLISNPIDFFINSAILLIFVIFSIREFKKYYNSNLLHFWQGINVGILTIIIIGLVSSFWIYVHLTYINPDLLNTYREIIREQLISNKHQFIDQFGQNVYDESLLNNNTVSPLDLALDEFFKKKFFAGFFITTIIAVVMRQRPVTINN